MALTQELQYSTSNTADACTTMIFDDVTGTYNASTNPTGYGAPNAERTALALYIFVTKKGYGGTADSSIAYTNDETAADTVTQFSVTGISVDGWFRVRMVSFPQWDNATVYAVNQIVWYSNDLYICTGTTTAGQAPDGAGAADWDTATVPTLTTVYDNVSTYSPTSTIYLSEYDHLQVCLSNAGFADLVAENSKDNCCADCGSENEQLLCKVRAMLEGAKVAAARARFLQGEQKILVVTDLLAGKDCFACK